jgi:alanine-glyoxylate transaminase / serine-glyoxylate transaminase / serine-pyruvate transaminase
LGHFNDLMLAGTLSGVEMGLNLANVPHKAGGINAALECLTASQRVENQSQMAEAALR